MEYNNYHRFEKDCIQLLAILQEDLSLELSKTNTQDWMRRSELQKRISTIERQPNPFKVEE